MSDKIKVTALHNGAIVVDADTMQWGEPEFDQSLYHFSLIRHPMTTVERRPGAGNVRLTMQAEQIVLVRPGDVEHVYPDSKGSDGARVNLVSFMFRDKLLVEHFGKVDIDGMRDITDPISANLLMALAGAGSSADPLLVDHLTMAIICRIRGMRRTDETRSGGRIERAIAYINERLSSKLTLDELAGAAAMSPYHFLRTFKQTTGTTPLAYVTAKRLERAKAMLATTDLPISEVAAACGFSSQSHFTSSFSSATGATPRAFRVSLGRKILASLVFAAHSAAHWLICDAAIVAPVA